jgi:hypothetical protein
MYYITLIFVDCFCLLFSGSISLNRDLLNTLGDVWPNKKYFNPYIQWPHENRYCVTYWSKYSSLETQLYEIQPDNVIIELKRYVIK